MTIYLVMIEFNREYLNDFIHAAFLSKKEAEAYGAHLQQLQQDYQLISCQAYGGGETETAKELLDRCHKIEKEMRTKYISYVRVCIDPLKVKVPVKKHKSLIPLKTEQDRGLNHLEWEDYTTGNDT